MISPALTVHNMRAKSKWMLAFLALVAFAVITCRHNFLSFTKTASSLQLMFGSRVTISFHQPSNIRNQSASLHRLPAPKTKVKIMLWSQSLADADEKRLFPSYGKPKLLCPVNYVFISDKEQAKFADVVIIDVRNATDLPPRRHSVPWILRYDEPPIVYNALENKTFMEKFNYSIGYRMDSDFPSPRISEPVVTTPLDFHQKFDYVAAIFSKCTIIRTDYAKELSKYIRVKSYGDCLRNVEKNNLVRKGEKGYIASKKRLLKLYKFSLNLMRYDCKDYVDETLNHAWETGTLPVFLGTDSLYDILPNYLKTSFIQVSRFYKPINLADKLEVLTTNKGSYEKFMAWREPGRKTIDNSLLWKIWRPDYSPGCQIAMTVERERLKGKLRIQRTVDPITCEQRDINRWLGKTQKVSKVNDN